MTGTIVFSNGAGWAVSSGVFNWVINYLADTIDDQASRDELLLIDRQNFRWLNLSDLSITGRRQVLSILGYKIESDSRDTFPEGDQRADVMARIGELAKLARFSPY
jgi:hypothetical protein